MQQAHNSYIPKWLVVIGMAASLLAAFSYAFVPLRASQDEWWHLKTGKWIWEHRTLPVNDIFTYTGEDYRWYNHEWLSQLLFYGWYRAGEWLGTGPVRTLVLMKSLVVVGTFGLLAWLIRLRGAAWPAVMLLTFLAAEIARRTIYPRPPIFSYLLLTVFLLILYSWKEGRLRARWLWLLPAITVIWGNLHGMVLLAVVAVGAFAAGETLEFLLVRSSAFRRASTRTADTGPPGKTVVLLWALFVLTVIAAMAQPSGYHLFFLGRNFTADPLLQQEIAEMKPSPFFLQPTRGGGHVFVPGFASFWIGAGLLLPLLLWNRLRLPFAADYMLAGFFLYQGAMHWRLLPLFAIGAAPAYAALLADLAKRISPAVSRVLTYGAIAATVLLSAGFVFFVDENGTFFQRNRQLVRGEVMSFDDYPVPLVDMVEACDLPDRMFSESNYCGYFMWRLSPERHKLFTDNRFDLFGSRFRKLERIILAAGNRGDRFTSEGEPFPQSWDELLNQYGVNFLVIHRESRPGRGNPLHAALIRSGKWSDVYYYMPPGALAASGGRLDPNAGWSVWVRNDPKFEEARNRVLAYFKREYPNYPLPEQLDAMLVGDAASPAVSTQNRGTTNWRLPAGR